MGPSTLVVKRGEYGAMLVDKNGVFCVPAFPLEEPHDPTGAGDSFAGGFMGYVAGAGSTNDAALRRAMVYGSVLGSFTVEALRPRAPAEAQKARDTRQGTPLFEIDPIQTLGGKLF